MNWKEFLKPNKKKIFVSLIVLAILYAIPIIYIEITAPFLLTDSFNPFAATLFWFPVPQFGVYQCGSCAYLKDTEYVVCANGEKLGTMCSCISKLCINWPYILLNVLFWIFFAYLISCLLFREGMPKKQVKRKG